MGLRIKSLVGTRWVIVDQGICQFCVVRNVRIKRSQKAGSVGNKRDAKKKIPSLCSMSELLKVKKEAVSYASSLNCQVVVVHASRRLFLLSLRF